MNIPLNNRIVRRPSSIAALFLVVFSIGSPLLAEPPVRINIPGTAFSQDGAGAKAVVENVGSGRRFRGNNSTIILKATIQVPPPSSAESKLERLAIHFRSDKDSGASVRLVEVRHGSSVPFHLETNLRGDYAGREMTQPAVVANTWVIKPPISVTAQSVIRLEVLFGGGFHGSAPSDIVITAVALDFPRKAAPPPANNAPVLPLPPTNTGPVPPPPPTNTGPVPPPSQPQARAAGDVIYAVTADNELFWYSHSGRKDGTFSWATSAGKKVGSGWNFKQVFSGGDGVIYGITDSGDLMWYRHEGRGDGSFRWAADQAKKVGTGWNFKQVFPGGGGVIYAITDSNELLWYRHDGRNDGSMNWAAPEGKKVGTGWNLKQVFSGGDGVIYGITDVGDLMWYRHEGRGDGSFRWAADQPKKVGTGWNFKQVFPGVGGVIYAITDTNDLMWYRHDGRKDGSMKWATPEGKKVGSGWAVQNVFCGEILGP